MPTRKQITFIAIVLGALLLIAVAVYFLFFANQSNNVSVGEPSNPFGEAGDYEGQGELPAVGVAAPGAGEQVAPRLVKITDGPVAYGVVAITIPAVIADSSSPGAPADTEVRYVERASGHVYAYRAVARTLTRLTNQTLPGIEEVSWLFDGSRAFLRFLSDNIGEEQVETYSLPVIGTDGYFFESGLEQVVVTEAGVVLTLLPSLEGSVATLADGEGGNVRTLFSSPLSALRVYPANDEYVAHTKASAGTPGYGFAVRGGVFERLVGPLRGLALLPNPVGPAVFYSYLSGQSLQTALVDAQTREVTPLPLATLAEKCVWTSDGLALFCAVPRSLTGTIPDDWYQGVVLTSDRIWRVDLQSRVATLVLDPTQSTGVDIDAVSLSIDSENEFLFFTNRADGSLWAFSL